MVNNERIFDVQDNTGKTLQIFVNFGTVTKISIPLTQNIAQNFLLAEKDSRKFDDYERALKYSLNLFFNQTPNEFIDFYKCLDKTSVASEVASELISQKLSILKELVSKLECILDCHEP